MAGLRFVGVRKDYGDVPALRGLDLEVQDGELMVLAGPSGCGKTTALRVAAGLESPTEGSVHIAGRDVTRIAPAARNVSMVFQSYALFPHLTVSENIGFGLVARGVRRAEAQERVHAAAERVGCETLLARRPFELSGGERQRVALARALVREPDVFLLDEPLSNLDAQLRVEMRAELKLLHQRVGATMLYVTHDQVEAMTLGTRLAVLRDGALQQVGTPDEVYRRPVNRFVATFVGSPSMNVLPAVVDGDVLRTGRLEFRLPREAHRRLDGAVQIGIRPEDVRIAAGSDGAPATVLVVETAGPETFLHLEIEGHTLVARVPGDVRPAPGSSVRIELAEDRVYVFDRKTGETLVQPEARPR